MNIYINNEQIDIKNISITNFREEAAKNRDNFFKEIDFSMIKKLKGDKRLLSISFLNTFGELTQ